MRSLLPVLALVACNPDTTDTGDGAPVDEPLSAQIADPEDGTFSSATTASVSGTATGPVGFEATLGATVLAPTDGNWTTDAAFTPVEGSPVWPLLVQAKAPDGAWVRDRITLVHGDPAPAGDPVVDGLVLRITDVALAEIRPTLEAEIAALDPSEFAGSNGIERLEIGEIELTELDFTMPGLAWGLSAVDFEADVGEVGGIDVDKTITADRIDVDGVLVIGAAADGSLEVTPTDTTVVFTGLEIDGLSQFLVDMAEGYIADELGKQIEKAIAEALADALASQEQIREIALGSLTIKSDFTRGLHDPDGVSVFADSRVEAESGPLAGERLSNPGGALVPRGATFGDDETPYEAALFIDDDLLSVLGVGIVAEGLLDQEISGEVGGLTLDSTLLGGMIEAFEQLPDATPITLVTRPTIAPPASPGVSDGEAARLHLGGLGLDFLADADGDGSDEVVLSVVLDMVAGLSGGEESLLDIDVVSTAATVVETTLDIPDPEETETSLAGALSVLLPTFIGDALGGAALDQVSVVGSGTAGTDGDRAALWLDVSLLPEQ